MWIIVAQSTLAKKKKKSLEILPLALVLFGSSFLLDMNYYG